MRRSLLTLALVLTFLGGALPAGAQEFSAPYVVPGGRALVGSLTQSLGFAVGRIQVPAIGIDETIREGVDIAVINRGPAHWAGTAMPGQRGNMVLAGHRTTYSQPFHDLDRLQEGDDIWVTGVDGVRAHYQVAHTMIVEPTAVWIADPTPAPILTLFACHPKGSLAQRIVVRAKLVDAPILMP